MKSTILPHQANEPTTTAEKVFESIRFAAESARRHCPNNEQVRIESFVCYLSGALKNAGPEGEAVAEAVFGLFKNDSNPTNGA